MGRLLSESECGEFRKKIYDYYGIHGRDLPWRRTFDPYRIFVSEMMLQQTQVERVRGKYEEFTYLFPSFAELAESSLKDVLLAWQGLGYNRRAQALFNSARIVSERYGGCLPATIEELTGLPGIGRATASAILCFAFQKPVPFIETNIRRVYIDHFFEGRETVRDKEILPLVEETLDRASPRRWYYALMDYGSKLGRGETNVNRRSAHYRRQTPFRDSDRRIRGEVVRLLLADESLSVTELTTGTGVCVERLLPILASMEREGLVKERSATYCIGCGDEPNDPRLKDAAES